MFKIINKKTYKKILNELEKVKKENDLLKQDPASIEDLKEKRKLLISGVYRIEHKIKQINKTFGYIYDRKTHKKLIK